MRILLLLLWLASAVSVSAQSQMRRLPGVINHPSYDQFAPYISHDGNALLFISNTGEDGAPMVMYTSRESDWTSPVELSKSINNRLTYVKGFALSADGKRLYFTSAKSPVIGGYDIMTSELRGTTWTEPQNLLLPINSKTNEGSPSLTPDGNTMYFMRCDKMDQRSASGCKIFKTSKKSNGQWEEPQELPASINTGNSQSPRIMADSETLIFSSDKLQPSKGGMDLYQTRFVNGSWTNPVPLDFANTDGDDQFVSVTALGRYLIKEARGNRNTMELVELLIPDALRPKGMMKVEGTVVDQDRKPVSSYITVIDLNTGKRVHSSRPAADGSYFFYLMEGSRYEVAVDPEQSKMSFFSKQLDLTGDKILQRERIPVVIKSVQAGDVFELNNVNFKPASADLQPDADADLKRLARLIKANPELTFEVGIHLYGLEEDSIRSSPELTEVSMDSIATQVGDIDSLGQLIKVDTVLIKTRYHNNRTEKQAFAVVDQLKRLGIPEDKLTILTEALPAPLHEERRTVVRITARNNKY